MAPNPLRHFIEINYHVVAPHTATIPTRAPASPTPGSEPVYTSWGGADLPGGDMVDAFAVVMKAFLPPDVGFIDNAVFWSTPVGGVKPLALAQINLAVEGTSAIEGWNEAVQRTWTFKTTAFNNLKIVILDSPTNNQFARYTSTSDAVTLALNSYILGDTHAIAGRDGNRPVAWWSLTIDLNERLRREYHLS